MITINYKPIFKEKEDKVPNVIVSKDSDTWSGFDTSSSRYGGLIYLQETNELYGLTWDRENILDLTTGAIKAGKWAGSQNKFINTVYIARDNNGTMLAYDISSTDTKIYTNINREVDTNGMLVWTLIESKNRIYASIFYDENKDTFVEITPQDVRFISSDTKYTWKEYSTNTSDSSSAAYHKDHGAFRLNTFGKLEHMDFDGNCTVLYSWTTQFPGPSGTSDNPKPRLQVNDHGILIGSFGFYHFESKKLIDLFGYNDDDHITIDIPIAVDNDGNFYITKLDNSTSKLKVIKLTINIDADADTYYSKWSKKMNAKVFQDSSNIVNIYASAATDLNGFLYMYGGMLNNGSTNITTNRLLRHDYSHDTWISASMSGVTPEARSYHSFVTAGDKAVMIGGISSNETLLNDTWVMGSDFRPKRVAEIPVPLHMHGAVVRNNKVVVFGGCSKLPLSLGVLNTEIREYDIENNTWTTVGNMPVGLISMASAVDDSNNIWVYGGYDKDLAKVNTLYVIRPDNTVELVDTHTNARGNCKGFYYNNWFYVYGGDIQGTARFEAFDINESKWIDLSENSPPNRNVFAMTPVKYGFEIVGGILDGSATNETWRYVEIGKTRPEIPEPEPEPEYAPYSVIWKKMTKSPYTMRGHCTAIVGEYLYSFGGYVGGDTETNKLLKYHISSDTWTEVTPTGTIPRERMYSSMVSFNGKLYLYGGYLYRSGLIVFNDLWEYDPENNTWSEKSSGLVNVYSHAATVRGNKMVIIGGNFTLSEVSDKVFEYDFYSDTWSSLPEYIVPVTNHACSSDGKTIRVFFGGSTTPVRSMTTVGTLSSNNEWSYEEYIEPRLYGFASYYFGNHLIFGSSKLEEREKLLVGYSPSEEEKQWSRIGYEVPDLRINSAYAATNEICIVSGGSSVSNVTDDVWKCEVKRKKPHSEKKWIRLADFPDDEGIRSHAATKLGDDIYTYGSNKAPHDKKMWKYNIPSNTWVEIEQPISNPLARVSHSLTACNGKLYLYGGSRNSSGLNDIWEYTPETNTWVKKANGMGSYLHSAFNIDGKVVAFGGASNSSSQLNQIREYNPSSNSWRSIGTLADSGTTTRFAHDTDYINVFYYMTKVGTTIRNDTGILRGAVNEKLPEHQEKQGCAIVSSEGIVYTFGASKIQEKDRRFEMYDLQTNEWSNITDDTTPLTRTNTTLTDVGDGIIMIGGNVTSETGVSSTTNEVWFFG